MTREHLSHFNIAGFTYYDGPMVFQDLKIGTRLSLQWDKENRYDPRAMSIFYNDVKLGYVPRSENRILYKLSQVGLLECAQVHIQKLAPYEHPENQIQVVVHLIGK